MRRSLLRIILLGAAAAVATLALSACGSSDNASSGGGGGVVSDVAAGTAAENEAGPGKRGGDMTVLSAADVDFIDPGETYYTYANGIMDALHRKLYTFKPDNAEKPVPDLASADPEISQDGRTVTIKIRPGVMFSKPVDREVTSQDVKYAIERGFTASVPNGYARAYFGDLVGTTPEPGDYKPISGIQTPDDQTIVFKLKRGTGAVLAGALALPLSAPVPKEYAQKFDQKTPSTYGLNQVFTGPYAIPHDADGKLTGYKANRLIKLERNQDYVKAGDFRPAFVDSYTIQAGNSDTAVAARRILAGKSLISGDLRPSPQILQRILRTQKDQVSLKPAGAWRLVSMDTQAKPFDDLNVRKAVLAGFDRIALRLQRGGEAIGPIAQGYIPPGVSGFDESGGEKGFGFDFMANPKGDKQLSAEYFKKAGFASGKYEGGGTLLMVADSADPDKSIAQSAEQQLNDMGFETKLRLVNRNTMFTKFCQVPSADVNVCPSDGWAKDFADPQTMLDPTFNGKNILKAGNQNWPELDVPAINAAMTKAEVLVDPDERAQAWADVNKQVVAQAPGIPYVWDFQSVVSAPDVRGVQNEFNSTWDLNYTSVK